MRRCVLYTWYRICVLQLHCCRSLFFALCRFFSIFVILFIFFCQLLLCVHIFIYFSFSLLLKIYMYFFIRLTLNWCWNDGVFRWDRVRVKLWEHERTRKIRTWSWIENVVVDSLKSVCYIQCLLVVNRKGEQQTLTHFEAFVGWMVYIECACAINFALFKCSNWKHVKSILK